MNVCAILFSLLLSGLPLRTEAPVVHSEELVYVIHYKWGILNADVARLYCSADSVTYEGQRAYRARIYGKTAKMFDSIVRVREDFTSYLSASDLSPLRSEREADEAKFKGGEVYNYDREAGKLLMKIETNSSYKEKEFPLEKGLVDVPALFYSFTNADIQKMPEGEPFGVKVAVGDTVEEVFFKYMGRQNIKIRGIGKVDTHKFLIQVNSGQTFDPKNAISIYASDRDGLLPLYFEAPMRLGKVVGRLESPEQP